MDETNRYYLTYSYQEKEDAQALTDRMEDDGPAAHVELFGFERHLMIISDGDELRQVKAVTYTIEISDGNSDLNDAASFARLIIE